MARIPESELQRLKEEISVRRLVEAAGIELKPSGKDQLGRCPFHDDAEPSLVITPAKNLWHCFGCGIGGGPIDWVMKKNRVSFRHAVELLRAQPSLAAEGASPARIAKLPPPVALDAGEQELLDQVIGFYHQTLLASPEALARTTANPGTYRLGGNNCTNFVRSVLEQAGVSTPGFPGPSPYFESLPGMP
jgi:DNA primase